MADVAKREKLRPNTGQSPFALQRGQRFERQLFRNDAEVLRAGLEEAGVLPTGSKGLADFRMRHLGGTCATLDEALARTMDLLASFAKEGVTSKTPSLIAGATICVPGRAMLPEAILVMDALIVRKAESGAELVVGEIKTYPDRGGHTDRTELAGARAQSGVYVHALAQVLRENAWTRRVSVSMVGFLVLTKPGSNRPSVRAREDLRYQAERAARGLEKLRGLAGTMAPSGAHPEDPIAAVLRAPVHYEEACIRFCDRASGCFKRACRNDDPSVLGDDAARLLGTISLKRVAELLHGGKPKTHAERQIVVLAGTRAKS